MTLFSTRWLRRRLRSSTEMTMAFSCSSSSCFFCLAPIVTSQSWKTNGIVSRSSVRSSMRSGSIWCDEPGFRKGSSCRLSAIWLSSSTSNIEAACSMRIAMRTSDSSTDAMVSFMLCVSARCGEQQERASTSREAVCRAERTYDGVAHGVARAGSRAGLRAWSSLAQPPTHRR